MLFPTRPRYTTVFLALILVLVLPVDFGFGAQNVTARASEDKVTIANYELIGTTSIPTGTQFEGTEVGGLGSSIAYDSKRGAYYAISDDQGTIDPVRYYTLSIDVSDGQLDSGDISFLDVTTILDASGAPYAPRSLDPEGLALAHEGQLYIS